MTAISELDLLSAYAGKYSPYFIQEDGIWPCLFRQINPKTQLKLRVCNWPIEFGKINDQSCIVLYERTMRTICSRKKLAVVPVSNECGLDFIQDEIYKYFLKKSVF